MMLMCHAAVKQGKGAVLIYGSQVSQDADLIRSDKYSSEAAPWSAEQSA